MLEVDLCGLRFLQILDIERLVLIITDCISITDIIIVPNTAMVLYFIIALNVPSYYTDEAYNTSSS
jgi:hypothetical protein